MSGRQDLNLRPFAPKANALPDCATPRSCKNNFAGLFLHNTFNISKKTEGFY